MRMNAAETNASRAIADCTPLTVVSRSSTTAEIETFINEVSTTRTNIAIDSRTASRRWPPWASTIGRSDPGIATAAVGREGEDREDHQRHAEHRPQRLVVDPRQERDGGDPGGDDAEPSSPLGSGHDARGSDEQDDPDRQPDPAKRAQVALEDDRLQLVGDVVVVLERPQGI